MEIRVKLTRPVGNHIHNVSKTDENVLIYYLKREDTLENLINQIS